MALADLEVFLRERAAAFDSSLDLTTGSPFDVAVIQPVLRRLGTDPFTVDIGVFLQDRLNQEFPALPTKEGDALTDLLIKTAVVLWDPIIRENFRVRQNMSFQDPTILTTDEAEALGANLFAERSKGDTARGKARIYFAQAQSISISPANFVTSQSGLHFFPTEIQSISVNEMLFNVEADLYYFDVNLVAEKAGDEYNIGPDQLVTIANLGAAVRVTNKLRFRFGEPQETAVEFVDRIGQDLTERSLVTERGIISKLASNFSEISRVAVTGFNDPEMQRDVLQGGGLGSILSGGVLAQVLDDGEAKSASRRIQVLDTGVDFTALVGPLGESVTDYTITVHSAYLPGSTPIVRDLTIKKVVNTTTIDVNEQVLLVGATSKPWALRKNELTLSGIPGGILFPDTAAGTVSLPSNQVHIGGATDVFVRGTDFDSGSLLLTDLVDDTPVLQGLSLKVVSTGTVRLDDLTLGTNYSVGDATYLALANAVDFSLQVRDTPIAGSYRIISVAQASGLSPYLTVSPAPDFPAGSTNFRWRLLDVIDVDLAEPKETKITGSDLITVQGVDVIDTASGVDFDTYGVGPGDTLRILSGTLTVGDYTVVQVLAPLYTRVQVDRPLPATRSGVKYQVFRSNTQGGVKLPFVRVSSIDLLDTSSQPVGSKIPYAKPIDIRSRSFANASHGVKSDVRDARLGIVGKAIPAGANVSGQTLAIKIGSGSPTTVTFTGSNPRTAEQVVSQVNTALGVTVATVVDGNKFGLLPIGPLVTITSGSAIASLFDSDVDVPIATNQVRSATIVTGGGWVTLRPSLDSNFDVAQVLDGTQIGFYDGLTTGGSSTSPLTTSTNFYPETARHLQVGSRSFGSARLYFLEPTSIEFGPASRLVVTGADGSLLSFFPDPTLTYQKIPALPSGVKPKDGSTNGSSTFTSAGADFIQKGIVAGDVLSIDYYPISGSALADPVPGLAFQTIVLSINSGVDKTIIFVKDDTSIPSGAVTRQGVADQINKVVGQTICKINALNALEFEADASIVVRGSGTANTTLGFALSDTNNTAPAAGKYTVVSVTPTTLDVTPSTLPTGSRQQYKVLRSGVQRIVSTQMSSQVAETGLYYYDLELISLGTGDQYNIESGLQMDATGYASDGYYLTTDDPNLAFSPVEKPRLHFSRSIFEVGTNDDPDNATQLSGQNIQINYDRSVLAGSVQDFLTAETERVICQSPLARHLIPYFVRLDLTYVGGSKESEVTPDIEKLIKGLFPKDTLDVSDLEKILSNRGARSIDNPINLLAVVHNFDRSVTMERSQDRLNTGRLAAFLPDKITVTRKIS